ncbi:MAG: cellulase family glycosylhydrolase [Chitinispirillaceae bacterium]|nr:cellulase family glycosylhydrolase [Chitinispirillaceae bacterium]
MKKNLLAISMICAALLCSGVSLSAETPVERHGKLKTKGGYLLNEHDSIVQLRGMSFYWSTNGWIGANWYNTGTLDALVDYWKCSVVRIAYDGKDNWNKCQELIDHSIKRGIYVIIDWHSHTAHESGEAPRAVSFFTDRAKQYKNTPNVIFEPYNEPKWAGGAQAEVGTLENALKTWSAIKGYLKDVTKAIRAQGAENLVILGTPFYAQYVNVAANDQVMDDGNKPFTNVAYSFHFYAASHGPEAYFVKNENDGGMEPSYLGPAIGKVPIFITEWGTTHYDGGQRVDCANTGWWFTNWVDKNHISHVNWSACSGETSSAFAGSATSPSESGTCAKKYIAVSTKDYWARPDLIGKKNEATKDSVFDMPGTRPTVGYNMYSGANFIPGNVPFKLRDDKTNVRTSANTALNVPSNIGSDEWVEYNIKSSKATTHIIFRYLAVKSSGTINILLDGKSLETVSFATTKADSSWEFKVVPAAASSGSHKLRFEFSGSTGDGYYVSWFEMTDNPVATIPVSYIENVKVSTNIAISQSKSGITLQLPQRHPFHSYTLFGVNGRAVASAQLSKSTNTVSINALSSGTWFVQFIGKDISTTQKVVFNGN